MSSEKTRTEKWVLAMLAATLALSVFNAVQFSTITDGTEASIATGYASASSGEKAKIAALDVIPKGVPEIYGTELSVSFDDVTPSDPSRANAAIGNLAQLDREITLEGENLERYIKIGSSISCEYCCGAKAIIFENGQPACGCAHSYAMRGLAKYLLVNHGDEYTDEQILEELGKWKTLFFPNQISAKAQILSDQGIELNYISLASNQYRGIEKGATGGMVGGC